MTSHPTHDQIQTLDGCEDFATAMRRADDLIPQATREGERWDQPARRILALFLHAAALSGRSLPDVLRWTTASSPATDRDITTALQLDPDPYQARAQEIRTFWRTHPKSQDSVLLTIAAHLARACDDEGRP